MTTTDKKSNLVYVRDEGRPIAAIAMVGEKGSQAIGGLRILQGQWHEEGAALAIDLAKAMQRKAQFLNLPLGGAKAVMYVPRASERSHRLELFANQLNLLKGRYITAVDMGSNAVDMGFVQKISSYVTCTQEGYSYVAEWTAATVCAAVDEAILYRLGKGGLGGGHVVVQGMGKVGQAVVRQLRQESPDLRITMTDLFSACTLGFELDARMQWVESDQIYDIPGDVLITCGGPYGITKEVAKRLPCPILATAANLPLADQDVAAVLQKRGILWLQDHMINGGGLLYCAKTYGFIEEIEPYIKQLRCQLRDVWQ